MLVKEDDESRMSIVLFFKTTKKQKHLLMLWLGGKTDITKIQYVLVFCNSMSHEILWTLEWLRSSKLYLSGYLQMLSEWYNSSEIFLSRSYHTLTFTYLRYQSPRCNFCRRHDWKQISIADWERKSVLIGKSWENWVEKKTHEKKSKRVQPRVELVA